MKRKLFVLSLIFILSLSCSLFSLGEIGNVRNVAIDDAEMNKAIEKAQDTLPLFIQAFQSPSPTQIDFLIKAGFPYGEGDEAEHIWISDLTYSDNQFQGIVGNDPVYIKDIQYGDQVNIQISDISDWMIVDGDKLVGGYTIHVLRNRLSEKERKKFDQDSGLVIPEEPALP